MLRIRYRDSVALGQPKSIIAKFASRTPEIRGLLKKHYFNEANVYRNVGPISVNLFPEIYFVASDSVNGDICILMEDLGNESPGNNLDGISPIFIKARDSRLHKITTGAKLETGFSSGTTGANGC